MNLIVTPIFLSRDRAEGDREIDLSNPIDTKVRGLGLSRIGTSKYGLLSSSFVPQIALDLPVQYGMRKRGESSSVKKRKKLRMIPVLQRGPIGLWPVEPQGWLNAWMQFILFVPRFTELFYFAPKSFSLFREYIDRYHDDQEELKSVSSANGSSLLQFFSLRLERLSLKEVFYFLQQFLDAKWEIMGQVDEMRKRVDEFFVWEKVGGKLFLGRGADCYELDAFIELRPDGKAEHYIAYGKVGGIWYQCDDDQIVMIRSNFLSMPLARAALLHYKRIIIP